jgi:hypothetical protein
MGKCAQDECKRCAQAGCGGFCNRCYKIAQGAVVRRPARGADSLNMCRFRHCERWAQSQCDGLCLTCYKHREMKTQFSASTLRAFHRIRMALLFVLLQLSTVSTTLTALHAEWKNGNSDVHDFIEHGLVSQCENFVRAFDFGTQLVLEVVAGMQENGFLTVSLFSFICWARLAGIGRQRLVSLRDTMMSQLQRIRSHEELLAVLGQWLLNNPLHVAKEPYSPWGYGMGLNAAYTQQRLQRGFRSLKSLQCLDLRQPDSVASKLISRFGNGRATPFAALQICMDARLVPELSAACQVSDVVPEWVAKPGCLARLSNVVW